MKRKEAYAANVSSNDFITRIGEVVAKGEENMSLSHERMPLFLVVGAPRSGTTVLMQWLGQIGLAVPSNLAARFPGSPYFGGLIQRLLSDPELAYKDELAIPAAESFKSDYGKTAGPLSPHEYSFFFRRFFPVTVGEALSAAQLAACDTAGFVENLELFAAAMQKGAAVKGLLIQYHLALFAAHSNVFFIHTHRDEADHICSLHRHRAIVAGDADEWISVRPPEYDWLKALSPIEQVAGQVHYTNAAIARQFAQLPAHRAIAIEHEAFCDRPQTLFDAINAGLAAEGFETLGAYTGPKEFSNKSTYKTREGVYAGAAAALARVIELGKENHGGQG